MNIKTREQIIIDEFDFLTCFKTQGEMAYFRAISDIQKFGRNQQCVFHNADNGYIGLKGAFKKFQKTGCGIFFVVYEGGQCKKDITRIAAQWVDLDFRKYKNGQVDEKGKEITFYRSDEEVEQLKVSALEKVSTLNIEPSIINETKNGVHIFWLIEESNYQTLLKYMALQEKLCEYFGKFADLHVKDICHVARIPGYLHLKDPNNPFMVKCIKFSPEIHYTQQEIAREIGVELDKLEDDNLDGRKKKDSSKKAKDNTEKKVTSKDLDIDDKPYTEPSEDIQETETILYTYEELFQYLKKQDLFKFLKIQGETKRNFCCVFHDDTNPSACIDITKEKYYKYFCFSDHCEYGIHHMGWDIIDITMKLKKLSVVEALSFLCKHYNISFSRSTWAHEQLEKYLMNISKIEDIKNFKRDYPECYKLIKNAIVILRYFIEYGMQHIRDTECAVDGQSIFFVSNRYIQKSLKDIYGVNKDLKTVNRYINLLCILGLLKKVAREYIPKQLYSKAVQITNEKRDKSNKPFKVQCFYTVPYLYEALGNAEKTAMILKGNKYSVKAISRNMLENAFGEEFADSVYNKANVPHYNIGLSDAIIKIVLEGIDKHGYFCFEMLKNSPVEYESRNLGMERKYIEYKRLLPRLIKEFELEPKRANKELKEKYGITSSIDILIPCNRK
jgi:hypothetical protein